LCRNLNPGYRSILGDESDFVDLDAGFSGQRRLQLFRQRAWLRVSAGKGAYKPRKLPLLEIRRKVNAGNPGGRQQLRKTSLAGCGS
jgi:hypothetical protein